MDLKPHIRTVPDFPKPGILFYDISTLLRDPKAWRSCIHQMLAIIEPYEPDLLLGIESRGFLPAAPLAMELGIGFSMVRKSGKLPGDTIGHTYELEYGSDTVELQADAVVKGQKVVILDDLLATGGTMKASISLAKKVGANVCAAACIIELNGLGGRDEIDVPFSSLMDFDV